MANAKATVARLALPVTTPRERLAQRGVHALLDHEILAIALGDDSIRGLERAIGLLEDYGGIHGVDVQVRRSDARGPELTQDEACSLTAVRELMQRSLLAAAIVRDSLTSPAAVRQYLTLVLGDVERHQFSVVWLDAQNRVITVQALFAGTVADNSIYPREIVKSALAHNACAVILAQGRVADSEPTSADQSMTRHIQEALALIEVKVLDHFIVTAGKAVSFAERGLL